MSSLTPRGYFEIGIFHGKSEVNIGTLWRSAYQLGASGVFTIGRRYKDQSSDTTQTPWRIPLRHYTTYDHWKSCLPQGTIVIGIEMGGSPLEHFCHPDRAVYLLGAEDRGLSATAQHACQRIVSLSAVRTPSFNVAVAGSLVMYHRMMQRGESQ